MQLEVDHDSDVSIYMQIVERIQHMVATGELRPSEQLPTVRQVAEAIGVTPNTVARAYVELDREGVISTQQGRGTFVARVPDSEQLVRLRSERLHAIVNRALVQAFSLGYKPVEIRSTFEEGMRNWSDSSD